MNELENELFGMYRSETDDEHCLRCYELDRTIGENRKRCPPQSFWHAGKNLVEDNDSLRLAFVGKTSWNTPEDLAHNPKVGPVHDSRDVILDFYFDNPSAYWRYVRNITEGLQLSLDDIFVTNLVKCNIYDEAGAHYGNITDLTYFENCIGIFEKEIEMVRPTHTILFTNDQHDRPIGELRFGFEHWKDVTDREYQKQISSRKEIGGKHACWWHRMFYDDSNKSRMDLLRTRHPQGAPRELENEIADWIRCSAHKSMQ